MVIQTIGFGSNGHVRFILQFLRKMLENYNDFVATVLFHLLDKAIVMPVVEDSDSVDDQLSLRFVPIHCFQSHLTGIVCLEKSCPNTTPMIKKLPNFYHLKT